MPSPRNWGLWTKVIVAGIAVSVGGPALTYWVVPTEEELRSRYNPDLLRKSIEGRAEREAEFNEMAVGGAVWTVIKEEEENQKRQEAKSTRDLAREAEARREEMRKEAGLK
ncbi:CBP4-like protein [Cordyceps fumosorosea ARSEF 2679]|uniref:Cytochrome b mRNA-processing protein 4 n=1 Tax=Cordyceps fumosorosea (strain ARSEF 2679) TaxID=1081104 RepID=A0A162MXI1_CORFA|nr:CBP4-like protein [Cordyceps fumosorosea ARSEF 2679]OAA72219.1 CBP4-like protein [Cordyceps fumosorosea ARSEF 2679]